MPFFQILDCNSELGTCCNDYSIVLLLDAVRKIVSLIQLIAPILLIIMGVVGFTQLMINPERKGGIKSVITKFMAAVTVFSVPVLVDAVLGAMPQTFSVSACWEQAKISAEVTRTLKNNYVSPYQETTSPILIDPSKYDGSDPAEEPSTSGGSGSSSKKGSAKGQAIVSYAKKFVGKKYVYGGTWNGEEPYTGTDCSGFVQGVFKHNGISLSRTTSSQWADKSTYTLVNKNDIKPGDLVMYDGHVAILTGNGNEIIHAKGSKWGVVKDPDYTKCSSHAILGIMRIKGVN